MLKNLKIKYKILLLPSLVVTAFMALLFANQMLNERNEQLLTQIESGYYPSMELTWNLELALNTIHRYFQDAMAQADPQKLADTEPLSVYFVEQLADARKNSIIPEIAAQQLSAKFDNYISLAHLTARNVINSRNSAGLTGQKQSLESQYTEIKVLLQKAKQNGREEITAALASARINYFKSQRMIKSIILFCSIFLGGFSLIVARSITRPLKEIVVVSRKFASGNDDVAVAIDSRDEIGILGNAFNSMIEKIKKSKLKIENENWLKTGISELNDRLSGDLDIHSLSQNIIQFITPYASAQLGAIFLINESNTLTMVGSYAYSDDNFPNREFKLGQGIVGQCALEKKSIIVTRLPRDYVAVQSGLGQSAPAFLLVVPFMYEKKISGVIELASFSELTELQRAFLNHVAEKIAVSYHSTRSRIQITELLKKTQSQATELNQVNKELNDFAFIVSHDLKAPLRAIRSLANWLATDYADTFDCEGKDQIQLLMNRVERMHELINGVLQYSRVGRISEHVESVDLNAVTHEVIDLIGPPPYITIEIENTLPTISIERTRIAQVFQNLVSNAIKFMDKPAGAIKIGSADHDGFVKFYVADNGPGIEEKYFTKIFQIFQTLHSRDEIESTGVGLTLVKKIVEMYGGEVWVESIVGTGSTFYFTLPIHGKN
ncbi:MAG: ATP-binding protein [Candidatus Zhuqueibacterota bacterium]